MITRILTLSGSRQNAANSGQHARAPQQIVVERLCHLPHRRAAMFGETIERAQFGQGAQFTFRERHAPFQIVQ